MTTSADPRARTRRLVTTVLGVVLSLALLYWVMRGTSFADVWTHLRSARPGPLIAAIVIATATFLVRLVRWRILLRRPDGSPVSWSALWHAIAMGFMANNTLPFRLGEVVRAYAAGRLGGVATASALSSIAVERALDALTLLLLLGYALFRSGIPPDTAVMGVRLDQAATRAGVLCAVIFVGALGVLLAPGFAERAIRALVPWKKLADRLVALIESLRHGFSALKSGTRLAGAVFWSVAHWLVNGAAFWVAFGAFGIQVGFAGALLMQTLLAFGIAAPSTPGYFGVFEVVVAAALVLFGVPKDLGLAYGLTYHVTTFVPITLLGLWSLARTGLHVRDAAGTAK